MEHGLEHLRHGRSQISIKFGTAGAFIAGLTTVVKIGMVAGMASAMGATMGTIGWLASMMSSPVIGDVMGFALSSLGALLSWVGAIVSDWTQSMMLDLIGFGLAAYGVYEVFFKNKSPLQKLSPTAKSIMKGITAMEAGISAFELTTTVASHE